ncbi:MAG: DASS family sodium-coupled anion symporter [Hyphomonadaceae bacterium]|nr:DASS family sodium-coupled anion symporter [Hyphomonadaceae bacterium]
MADTANKSPLPPRLRIELPPLTPQLAGLVGGPLVALVILVWPAPANLTFEAWSVVALTALIVIWWVTGAAPMAFTALLPAAFLPLFGALPLERAAAAYADPIVLLLLSGFLLGASIVRWRAHERLAAWIVVRAEARPRALIAAMMVAAALLSMWVSSIVIALVLAPVAAAAAQLLIPEKESPLPVGGAMVLGVAYAAIIGAAGTPIGSPANMLAVEFLARAGQPISVLAWTAATAPIVIVMLAVAWAALIAPIKYLKPDDRERTLQETKTALERMGPLSHSEKRIATVFGIIAAVWLFRPFLSLAPGLQHLSDAGVALLGVIAFFLVPGGPEKTARPLLEWSDTDRMPWGVLILFGGGLSLAAGIDETGLAQWIGESLIGLDLPSLMAFVAAMVVAAILLGEVAFSVATLTSLLPILASVAAATGADLRALAYPVALAASFAFMLPVAAAPSAVAFASDFVTLRRMLTVGAVLNVAAALAIVLFAGLWQLG